ncbi:hypothetical protein [Lysobacter niastensis]|uniref:Uncharacterized protein n=2 Tax=Lysobacter niastensis TaxID=380629 RepID=A0ABS0BAA9_9GAMM|nr:hypothetical protein [Lysobacter niastensis]
MERQLGRDQRYFLTTPGHCDCGTVLGSHYQRARQAKDWAADEQRLLKKGWSKAKVARALAQKQESSARSDVAVLEASAADLASWTKLIAEILGSGTREFGLLLHSYRGPLDEDIKLKGTEQIATGDDTGEILRKMREDVLYVFLARA